MTRRIAAYLVAVLVCYLLAVISYSQLNLANLVELGMPVTESVRLSTAQHDLLGMAQLYLPIIAVALLIGILVAGLIVTWVPQLRTIGYMSAGFVAIYMVDYLLSTVVASGTHPLAVTRTVVGLLSQCVAGAVGGYLFALLTPTPVAQSK